MVLIHGWPDDESLWSRLVESLATKYYCACVILPGYDREGSTRGVDFLAVLEDLQRTIREIQSSRHSSQKVILVGHDWGAYISYLFERLHSQDVASMITLDVGAGLTPSSLSHALFLMSYQWWLVAAWAIGKLSPEIGDRMTRQFAAVARAPHPERARARMNYLYFYFWRAIFRRDEKILLKRYHPRVPILFIFGARKKFMFHTERWVAKVNGLRHSRVVEIKRAGHWLMVDKPEETAAAVISWLESLS